MNLANPFQTIRHEDRRDVQLTLVPKKEEERHADKIELAAMEIVACEGLGRRINQFERKDNPSFEELAEHHRSKAIRALCDLVCLIIGNGGRRLINISDDEMRAIVPALRATEQAALTSLQLKQVRGPAI